MKKINASLIVVLLFIITVISFTPIEHSYAANPIVVQSCINWNTGGNTSITCTLNAESGLSSDTYILVAAMQLESVATNICPSITDSQSLSYTQLLCSSNYSAFVVLSWSYAIIGTSSAADTITITSITGANGYLSMAVYEISHITISSPSNVKARVDAVGTCGCQVSGDTPLGFSLAAAGLNQATTGTWTSKDGYSLLSTPSGSNVPAMASEYCESVTCTTTMELDFSGSANNWAEGALSFGASYSAVTTTIISTLTITAWNVLNSSTSSAWVIAFLFLMIFPAFFWGFMRMFGRGMSSNLVFLTLIALTFGSLMGVIAGTGYGTTTIIPMGMTIVYGSALVLYIFRHRSRGGTISE